eukprot:8115077-Alexandrium_andersonii.AAC.1
MRDLGSQLNVGKVFVATTLKKRFAKAKEVLGMLSTLPTSQQNKVAVIAGKVLPMGLYGVPTTPVPVGELASLRSKIASALDRRAARSRNVTLAIAVQGRNVDPRHHILALRAMACRRAWYVTPWVQAAMQQSLVACAGMVQRAGEGHHESQS